MSKYVIETRNLTKQYGAQKSVASLNIHVQKGRIYGLLGRNVPRYEQETGSLFRHLQLWRELYT